MPFPLLTPEALAQITIGEIQTSKKGQRYAEVKFDGQQPIWQLTREALCSPWQAGVFQKDSTVETRQNLDLHCTEELLETLDQMDEFFEKELKKIMPKAQYHKLVQRDEGFPARIRLKCNAVGSTACRFWKADKTPLGDIRTIRTAGVQMIPCVCFTKAWSMGTMCGITCEARVCVITEEIGNSAADVFPL